MIFISYRIDDSLDMVGRLDADLTRHFGKDRVFRDKSRLRGGHHWTEVLEQQAQQCEAMLAVIGPAWESVASPDGDWKGVPRLWNPEDWVRREITLALDAGRLVIPVLLSGAELPAKGWLQKCGLARLWDVQTFDLRSDDYDADLANLVRTLEAQLEEPAPQKNDPPRTMKYAQIPDSGSNSAQVSLVRSDRERVLSLVALAEEWLTDRPYTRERRDAFRVAFGEATANAFEHGCASEEDVVQIELEVGADYASFSVLNPEGRTFDIPSICRASEERLLKDPRLRRGRGLLYIHELADRVSTLADGAGIKAVFERESVRYSVSRVDDVSVATLLSGIWNPSLQRKTAALAQQETGRDLILDFSRWSTGGSLVNIVILEVEEILARSGRRVAALLFLARHKLISAIQLPHDLVGFDVATVVGLLGRPELQERVEQIVERANRAP